MSSFIWGGHFAQGEASQTIWSTSFNYYFSQGLWYLPPSPTLYFIITIKVWVLIVRTIGPNIFTNSPSKISFVSLYSHYLKNKNHSTVSMAFPWSVCLCIHFHCSFSYMFILTGSLSTNWPCSLSSPSDSNGVMESVHLWISLLTFYFKMYLVHHIFLLLILPMNCSMLIF